MLNILNQRKLVLDGLSEMDKYSQIYGIDYDQYVRPSSDFIPYQDNCIDLTHDPYNDTKMDTNEVDDIAIENLVNKVLTRQAISLAEGKDTNDENDFEYDGDKIPDMHKVRSNMYGDSRLPRKKSKRSKSKLSKMEEARFECMYGDIPSGSEFSLKDGETMINLSIGMLRQYMYTEVEARVRHINCYYQRQWEALNKERLTTLGELIQVQDTAHQLRKQLDLNTKSLANYKEVCDNLGDKLESTKEAKRRRRQAKKHRKSEKTIGSDTESRDNDDNRCDDDKLENGVEQ